MKDKTINHILLNKELFTGKEKFLYLTVAFILSLPGLINKPFSNLFIFFFKGKQGIAKKDNFLKNELLKKIKNSESGSVRMLEFEKP